MKKNKFLLAITGVICGCLQIAIIISVLVRPSIITDLISTVSFSDNGIIQDSTSSNSNSDKSGSNGFFKNGNLLGFSKEVVIYNGITIDQGIKSNDQINNKAIQLTKTAKSDRERAKILYTWVGSNIKYDDNKADKVIYGKDSNDMPDGGAVCAFNSKCGICFDKACLYVAMCRSIGLKVRLIGGEAYDGEKYVGHAWNQVYLSDENRWINVDTTFYDGGNYFDSNLFEKHNVNEIVGEW